MPTAVTNIGKVLDLTGYTADQIMTMLSGYIMTHFGDAISIHDQVSTTQTVFRVQVTARHIPFYFHIIAASGSVQLSKMYRYWNAATHVGSGAIGNSSTVTIYNAKIYVFVSKNIIYMHQANSTYRALDSNACGLILALPTYYPSVAARTTADVVAGTSVVIPVDNTLNFNVGMKVAVADIAANGWGYATIAAVGTGQVTVATLNKSLGTGSVVCVPPNALTIRSETRCIFSEATLNGSDVGEGSMAQVVAVPLINNACFATDGVSGAVTTSPLAWPSTFGAAYHDIDAALCCGVQASINNFLARNTDGSGYVFGNALSGDTSTIIDTSKAWTPSALVGKYVGISGGSNFGNCRKVKANTATSITVDAPFPVAIDASSEYVVADSIYRYVDILTNYAVLRESW